MHVHALWVCWRDPCAACAYSSSNGACRKMAVKTKHYCEAHQCPMCASNKSSTASCCDGCVAKVVKSASVKKTSVKKKGGSTKNAGSAKGKGAKGSVKKGSTKAKGSAKSASVKKTSVKKKGGSTKNAGSAKGKGSVKKGSTKTKGSVKKGASVKKGSARKAPAAKSPEEKQLRKKSIKLLTQKLGQCARAGAPRAAAVPACISNTSCTGV